LNKVTQENAASAEESASAAQEMSSQAEEMRSMVASFKLSVSGGSGLAFPHGGQTRQTQQNYSAGNQGIAAMPGLHPDPRKIIPLEDKDDDVLRYF